MHYLIYYLLRELYPIKLIKMSVLIHFGELVIIVSYPVFNGQSAYFSGQ